MRSEAEQESRAQREKVIADSRREGEEIITKAQEAAEKLKEDMLKEIDIKAVDFGIQSLLSVLSEKGKGSLNKALSDEFTENLKTIDMSRLSPDVNEMEIISIEEVGSSYTDALKKIVKDKLKRDVAVKTSVDHKLGGGIIVKFGSMAIDGSLKNMLREEAVRMKETMQSV
jgi:F0F1-type ATP synthase delta subunit